MARPRLRPLLPASHLQPLCSRGRQGRAGLDAPPRRCTERATFNPPERPVSSSRLADEETEVQPRPAPRPGSHDEQSQPGLGPGQAGFGDSGPNHEAAPPPHTSGFAACRGRSGNVSLPSPCGVAATPVRLSSCPQHPASAPRPPAPSAGALTCRFLFTEVHQQRGAAGVPVIPAGGPENDSGGPQSQTLAEDGHHRSVR